MEQKCCHCPHGKNKEKGKSSIEEEKVEYVVKLIGEHFISPFKILYLLDPQQADHYKQRNQPKGCCSQQHVTIPSDQQTSTQKMLFSLLAPAQLTLHLDVILSQCAQKFKSIMQKGKQDKLQSNEQVEKFLLDKVLAECSNQYIFQLLVKQLKQNNSRVNKSIGLWATPATWQQQYPGIPLNFINNKAIAEIMNRGWTVLERFDQNPEQLAKEAALLQKDGKFEEKSWIAISNCEYKSGAKILSNPEKYAEIVDSQDNYLFPSLRKQSLILSSFPFELNLKANLFCTVSPNLHLCYAPGPCEGRLQSGSLKFTLMLFINSEVQLTISDTILSLKRGDLAIIDNSRHPHKLSCSKGEGLFLLRNFVDVVDKK